MNPYPLASLNHLTVPCSRSAITRTPCLAVVPDRAPWIAVQGFQEPDRAFSLEPPGRARRIDVHGRRGQVLCTSYQNRGRHGRETPGESLSPGVSAYDI